MVHVNVCPMDLKVGQKIVVFDANKIELGEGTFLRRTPVPEMKMVAYECEEHTILAKSPHYVRVGETLLESQD